MSRETGDGYIVRASVNNISEARQTARSSLYLAAALYHDSSSVSVKVRNVSSVGALVEGKKMPGQGSLIQLARGRLSARGVVVWSTGGRCGLRFSHAIDVAEWRAGPVNCEQGRVDEVVSLTKGGALAPPLRRSPTATERDVKLSDDLGLASRLLGCLGDALAANSVIVANYGAALQRLDIAMQVIAVVEAMMASDGNPEMDSRQLEGLRRSAQQALR